MKQYDHVTLFSSRKIDENITNRKSLQEQTERKKTMSQKLKIRVSALIMCAAMLVISMGVLAATKTETVPLSGGGSGTAFVGIYSGGYSAEARSSGSSVYSDLIETRLYGGGPEYKQATGFYEVSFSCNNNKKFTYATSTHKWTGVTHTMTVYP